MSTTPQNHLDDSTIDLNDILEKIGQGVESIAYFLFSVILFIKKNIIILLSLFIIGIVISYYLEETPEKTYKHELTVIQNFDSSDYLYSKINFLNSKIVQSDVKFFDSIGISSSGIFSSIKIEPIIDIYNFTNQKNNSLNSIFSLNQTSIQNFNLLKLLAENEKTNKIIYNRVTSKNYKRHNIKITTKQPINQNEIIDPVLNYLNDNSYFDLVQKSAIESLNLQIQADEKSILKIDDLLNKMNFQSNSNHRNELGFIAQSNQISPIISTKALLIEELALKKIELLNSNKTIKEINLLSNEEILQNKISKNRLSWSFILIGLFLFGKFFISFYKKQNIKHKLKQQ